MSVEGYVKDSVEDTVAKLRAWSDAYYNGEATVGDEEYDSVYDQLRLQTPDHPFFLETGAPIKGTKRHHTYFTGSLSKVKPDTPDLKRFLKKCQQLAQVGNFLTRRPGCMCIVRDVHALA